MEKMTLAHGWTIRASVDDDFHLNIFVGNDDGTQVHDNSEDNGAENEMAYRLTTQQIEDEYKED
jgi:hypothetical protein